MRAEDTLILGRRKGLSGFAAPTCIRFCLLACVHVVFVCTCTSMWKPQVDIRYLPQCNST